MRLIKRLTSIFQKQPKRIERKTVVPYENPTEEEYQKFIKFMEVITGTGAKISKIKLPPKYHNCMIWFRRRAINCFITNGDGHFNCAPVECSNEVDRITVTYWDNLEMY